MTTRSREQTLAFSEELSTLNPGSFLFSEPSVVDHWCQSLPGGSFFPPTPPDTDSEPDMTAKWNQASMPEDTWYTGPVQDHSTYVQSSSSEWDAQTLFSSAQDFQPLDAFHWTNTTQGSVDTGLSPVLSHESQSSHTLNSLPESELPAGLDLSFTFEPTWDTAGSVVAYDSQSMQRPLPGNGFVPSMDEMPLRTPMDDVFTQWPVDLQGCSTQPMFFSQGSPAARSTMRSPAVAAPRTLLPRTEGAMVPSTPALARTPSQRLTQSYIQDRASSRRSSQSVSNTGYAVLQSPRIPTSHYIAPRSSMSHDAKSASIHAMSVQHGSQSGASSRNYNQDTTSAIMDPAAEEFTAFIQYDQEEPSAPEATSSYSSGAHGRFVQSVGSSQETKREGATSPADGKTIKATTKAGAASSNEVDEGRHRNHPLYAKGPDTDGLFRCPFKAAENCPHKPTKLKCNYDKFVDSHLKPFRCRQEACAKQEFSSTACLLRHEREAHGMHGHGDRPHLCFYTGCERGLPGNGFPRRYNLFDHMKRVHDHKEDTSSGLASPEVAALDAQKKTNGRKRKAPSSTTSDPVAQRPKTSPRASPSMQAQAKMSPYQEVLPMPAQAEQGAYGVQGLQYPVASQMEMSRAVGYSQWSNQRTLSGSSFDFVKSPDNETGMAFFDGNAQALRRLPSEAHYG